MIKERANRRCKLALEPSDKSKYAKISEKLAKDKDLEVKVTRLRRMRSRKGTELIVFGTNCERKIPQSLQKVPRAIKINVLDKITLLRADIENTSVHSMKKLLRKLFYDLNTKDWAKFY